MDRGNRRATDCKNNKRVYLPKARPPGEGITEKEVSTKTEPTKSKTSTKTEQATTPAVKRKRMPQTKYQTKEEREIVKGTEELSMVTTLNKKAGKSNETAGQEAEEVFIVTAQHKKAGRSKETAKLKLIALNKEQRDWKTKLTGGVGARRKYTDMKYTKQVLLNGLWSQQPHNAQCSNIIVQGVF